MWVRIRITGNGRLHLQSTLDKIFWLNINSKLFFPSAHNIPNQKSFPQKWPQYKSYFQENVLQIM